jgi:hypothetical protein
VRAFAKQRFVGVFSLTGRRSYAEGEILCTIIVMPTRRVGGGWCGGGRRAAGGVVVWWCGGVVVWWCGVVVWCDGMALPQQSLVVVENALG